MAEKHKATPAYCPHCGKGVAFLYGIGQKTLDAALAVLNGNCETSEQVASYLNITTHAASMLLSRAKIAKLVSVTGRRSKSDRAGGPSNIYAPTQRIAAFDLVGWRRYERNHYRKTA